MLALPILAEAAGGFYAAAGAGAERPEGQNVTQTVVNSGSSSGNLQYGDGFIGALAGGYSFANSLRPELELSNRHSSTSGVGENTFATMANLWYDIIQNGYFFYAGGGIGRAELHLATVGQSASAGSMAWQLGAGFGFVLTPRSAVSVDFRHLETSGDARFNFPLGGGVQQNGYSSNALMLGLRWSFGGQLQDAAIMPVDPVKLVPLPR